MSTSRYREKLDELYREKKRELQRAEKRCLKQPKLTTQDERDQAYLKGYMAGVLDCQGQLPLIEDVPFPGFLK